VCDEDYKTLLGVNFYSNLLYSHSFVGRDCIEENWPLLNLLIGINLSL